jgi:hypothetical protein
MALQWLLGCLPIMLNYGGTSTASLGLPQGLPQSFLFGLLFTGVLITGILGALLADLDEQHHTHLLLITSGYSRNQTLIGKLCVGIATVTLLMAGQLVIDIIAAEFNALMAIHRMQMMTWPSWSTIVVVWGLLETSLCIGLARPPYQSFSGCRHGCPCWYPAQ